MDAIVNRNTCYCRFPLYLVSQLHYVLDSIALCTSNGKREIGNLEANSIMYHFRPSCSSIIFEQIVEISNVSFALF